MNKSKTKRKYRSIKILEEDYFKVKKWALVRDLELVEIIHLLVAKDK